MINQIGYSISPSQLQEACNTLPDIDFKFTLNTPTGNFFYDPWELKPEFKNTVWEEIFNSLPGDKGEARLIKLAPGTCYWAHADIDDRWHLSLINELSFLAELKSQKLHTTELGVWYEMNAGLLHSAVNFGEVDRVQLVVRKLLTPGTFKESTNIKIMMPSLVNARYLFDQLYSPWLNYANRIGIIRDFSATSDSVSFNLNTEFVSDLEKLNDGNFTVLQK